MSIPSNQHVNGALLAIDEVNAAGGVMGRPLKARICDTRSDLGLYHRYADRLLTEDGVGVILGCCTSISRKVVLPAIERRNGLLLYPDVYEGFEYSPNVLYTGAATNQNTLPLARYLLRNGARRFVLIGADYIYPMEACRVMRDLVERQGGEVLDQIHLPFEASAAQIEQLVRRIDALKPDVVFNTLVGASICRLLECVAEVGCTWPIASHNVTEAEMLVAMETGVPPAEGHITAGPWFSSVDTPASTHFAGEYRRRFGARAAVSQYAAASYTAVHLFARALERAGDMDTQRIMANLRGMQIQGPLGAVTVDEDTNHTWQTPRVGRWTGRGEFEVVWEAREPAQPDPWLVNYGGAETMAEADA